jgi:hypothetical protein
MTEVPVSISIGTEGIDVSNEVTVASHAWSGIQELIETADHLFIYFNAIQAIIVPSKAFPSRNAFSEFANAVRGYLENVRS